MEMRRQLQCNALREREKRRVAKNNGEQMEKTMDNNEKSNTKNNENSASAYVRL
jgi:hypothetical protein